MVEFLKYFSVILLCIGIVKIIIGIVMCRGEKDNEQD